MMVAILKRQWTILTHHGCINFSGYSFGSTCTAVEFMRSWKQNTHIGFLKYVERRDVRYMNDDGSYVHSTSLFCADTNDKPLCMTTWMNPSACVARIGVNNTVWKKGVVWQKEE